MLSRMKGDQEFMAMHLEALYNHDARGRMLTVNDPGRASAPRFFLGRTVDGSLWRFHHDIEDDLRQALEHYCLDEPVVDDLTQSPHHVAAYTDLLAQHAPVRSVWSGPAYRFPDIVSRDGQTILVTGENSGLLRPHFEAWIMDVPHCQPFLALLQGEQAISVCGSVRITPQAHEAGVETSPDFRGRGCAARVVAAWAAEVAQIGAAPLYSTSWENTASQSVARKLGLLQYGADFHIT